MKRMMWMMMAFLMLGGSAHAAEVAKIGVNGMVCDFCAQGIMKVMHKKEEVKDVDVNLTDRLVTVRFKPDKTLSDSALKDIITNNGFTVVNIQRTKE
jgi:mercuric ion binding protein